MMGLGLRLGVGGLGHPRTVVGNPRSDVNAHMHITVYHHKIAHVHP